MVKKNKTARKARLRLREEQIETLLSGLQEYRLQVVSLTGKMVAVVEAIRDMPDWGPKLFEDIDRRYRELINPKVEAGQEVFDGEIETDGSEGGGEAVEKACGAANEGTIVGVGKRAAGLDTPDEPLIKIPGEGVGTPCEGHDSGEGNLIIEGGN